MNTFDYILLSVAGIQLIMQAAAVAHASRKGRKIRTNNAVYVPWVLILIVLYRVFG